MKPLLLLPTLALLTACASAPGTVSPIEVKVPVAMPCKVEVPPPPAFAVDALPLGAGIWQQMLALRAERLQRKGYEAVLTAAVEGCR